MGSRGSNDYTNGDYVNVHRNSNRSPTMSTSLDHTTDSLELGREQLELWQEIYKLGVSGVDKYIELPQIVVVGDQSSGKSSVLEAMTGVPFPRGSGMCTKFPTQIKLRKAPEKGFYASLIPEINRSPADKERFSRFSERVQGETDLAVILKLAENTIWPHGTGSNLPSKDILNLEFSGPMKPYLTVVDLPGIIHVPTGDQTKADLTAIRELAIDNMKNARTIILAVISAQNDIANQAVLDMAKQVDPSGARTLGIITKPDRSDSAENTDLFLKLALNQNVKLDLGWHVLRNRAGDEKHFSSEERDANEKEFFATSKWKVLDRKDVGIEALLSKVSKLLLRRFAEVVPHVVAEIERKLEQTRKELEDLGEGAGTLPEMRSKLANWCKISKDIVYNGAEGYYRDNHANPFFDSEEADEQRRKLRARIDLENERFEQDLRNFGHTVDVMHGDSPHADADTSYLAEGVTAPKRMTRSDYISTAIEPILLESTGKELRGDSNPLLVYRMFEKQSRNWNKLAARHMNAVERILSEFLYEVLDSVWPTLLQDRIWAAFVESPLETRRDGAQAEVERLCRDRTRYAKSYDVDFMEGVKKWEARFQVIDVDSSDDMTINMKHLTLGERYLAKMLAYYEVTSKIFTSNVIVQVIERHLIDSLEDVFDGPNVHEMSEENVHAIFEEDEFTRRERVKLVEEKTSLETGLRSARKLAARKDLKVYDRRSHLSTAEPLRLSQTRAALRGETFSPPSRSSKNPPQTPQPRSRRKQVAPSQSTPLDASAAQLQGESAYTSSTKYHDSSEDIYGAPATPVTESSGPPIPPYLPSRPVPQAPVTPVSPVNTLPIQQRSTARPMAPTPGTPAYAVPGVYPTTSREGREREREGNPYRTREERR